MIELRDTTIDELARIAAMERSGADGFVIPCTLERHRREFARKGVVYKSLYRRDEFIGFVILVLEADGTTVEFRRIVVSEPGRGYGSIALNLVHDLSRSQLSRTRVWLDVFEENDRARHVYEKSGYLPFGRSEYDGRSLIQYERDL